MSKKKKKARRTKRSVPFLRSTSWKRVREEALERDNHKCVICGAEASPECVLNVHHILYRKFFKELKLELDNLVCVCPKCHFQIHKGIGNFYLIEWLRKNRPWQYAWIIEQLCLDTIEQSPDALG